ncbi:hypothetical protein D3C87_1117460 [compost metagenome]
MRVHPGNIPQFFILVFNFLDIIPVFRNIPLNRDPMGYHPFMVCNGANVNANIICPAGFCIIDEFNIASLLILHSSFDFFQPLLCTVVSMKYICTVTNQLIPGKSRHFNQRIININYIWSRTNIGISDDYAISSIDHDRLQQFRPMLFFNLFFVVCPLHLFSYLSRLVLRNVVLLELKTQNGPY